MTIKSNKPRLRFKDELGQEYPEWSTKRLQDIVDYSQPSKYLVANSEYDDTYSTPVLTAGKSFILGYTNESQGVYAEPLPVIIFDDFTTAFKFVNFPFKAKSSAMKILIARQGENIRFIFEAMKRIKFPLSEHKRYWISEFQRENISYPSSKEQQKIADFLSAVDEKIEQLEKKRTLLEKYKQGIVQRLFSEELRFKDENGQEYKQWQQVSLSTIATLIRKPFNPSTENDDYPCIELESLSQNDGRLVRTFKSTQYKSVKNLFEIGDVLFGKLRPYLRKFWYATFKGVCSSEIWILRPAMVPSRFLFQLVQTPQFGNVANIQSGTRMPRSDWNIVSQSSFHIPTSTREQSKIADFLSTIDEKIDLVSRQIKRARTFKQGLLQQLFV